MILTALVNLSVIPTVKGQHVRTHECEIKRKCNPTDFSVAAFPPHHIQ